MGICGKFDKWYLHLFDKTQADLNWENPEVREEVKNIVRFWMEKGVKGFRFDVINLISKAGFEDDFSVDGDGRSFYTDGPRIHEFLQELARDSFAKDKDIITVGEMSSTTMEIVINTLVKNRRTFYGIYFPSFKSGFYGQ